MRIDPASHLVVGVRYAPSPNFDERPVRHAAFFSGCS